MLVHVILANYGLAKVLFACAMRPIVHTCMKLIDESLCYVVLVPGLHCSCTVPEVALENHHPTFNENALQNDQRME